MSNSTDTTGCISHRPNCRFFIMYEDYQDIALAASPEHENKLAAFWRVLETKTNDRITSLSEIAEDCKKKGVPIPEEHLWIEIPYSEFVRRSRKIYKTSAFQVAAAESERLGFSKSRVQQRPIHPEDPDSPKEDYKEYLFFTDVMQSVLNGGEMPAPVEINSPLLKSIAPRKERKKQQRAIEKNSPPLLKSIAPPVEINSNNNILQVSSKDESKGRESITTSAPSSPTPANVSPSSQPEPEKPKKPRTPKNEEPTEEQIRAVYAVFNELYREVKEDDPEFTCPPSKASTEAIKELIKCKATPARLRLVFMDMWNEEDDDGKHWWQENGHLTIKSVCNQYGPRIVSLESKKPQKGKKGSASPPPVPESSAIPAVPFKPRPLVAAGRR